MRGRGTLLLLAAVLVVGAWLWSEGMPELEEEKVPSPGAMAAAMITPVVRLDVNAILTVRLTRGEQTAAVQRPPAGWAQAENGAKVIAFVDTLNGLGRIQEIAVSDEEWGDFGLETAQRRVELDRNGTATVLIELGNRNPSATGIYARLDHGSEVVLIGALLEWEFDKLWRALAG
jgi:hypothetical protein